MGTKGDDARETTTRPGPRRVARGGIRGALAAALALLAGCTAGGPAPYTEAQVLDRLHEAGFQVEILSPPTVAQDDRSRFLADPVDMVAVRLSDGDGNRQEMTLIGFAEPEEAAGLDARSVDGFAARNWFFLGTIGAAFREPIQAALL